MEKVLLRNIEVEDSHKLAVYQTRRGYAAVEKVLKGMTPEQVIEEVSASGLRGRGGAGFPTGRKWSFVPKDIPKPKYLIANADESEPGTFKDRILLERDPHAVIEGVILAAFAIQSHLAFIYIRGEFVPGYLALERALQEARDTWALGCPQGENGVLYLRTSQSPSISLPTRTKVNREPSKTGSCWSAIPTPLSKG